MFEEQLILQVWLLWGKEKGKIRRGKGAGCWEWGKHYLSNLFLM